ncbi:MAG: hypothetical protein AB1467_06815 [Candidatus Diapherotrites archaeon]
MSIKIEIELNEKKELIELKEPTHKERKDWLKKVIELSKIEDSEKAFDELIAFREHFLMEHLIFGNPEIKSLDDLPAKTVDNIFEKLEGEMDFRMGLQKVLSGVPLSASQKTLKTESLTSK